MHILEKKTYVKPSVSVLVMVEEGHLCAYSKGPDKTTITVGPTTGESTLFPDKHEDGNLYGD